MQKTFTKVLCSILSAVLFVLAPSSTLADGVSTSGITSSPVLISAFQTGSSTSGKDEFIELYNSGNAAIDLAGWQVRYISAASTAASLVSPTQTVSIVGAGSQTILSPQAYFVLHTATVALPADVAGQTYSSTLPAAGGSIVLLAPDKSKCLFTTADAVAWGAGTFGQGNPIASSGKDSAYQRYAASDSTYLRTYDNATDFAAVPAVSLASAGSVKVTATDDSLASSTSMTLPVPGCTVIPDGGSSAGTATGSTSSSDTSVPGDGAGPSSTDGSGSSTSSSGANDQSGDSGATTDEGGANDAVSLPPRLTELLPNPAPPQTDGSDEFVELYNPNDVPFDLAGYTLVAGLTTVHSYTFPAGTWLPAHAFTAFFSADTGLSLSNGGGEVKLHDPSGAAVDQTSTYDTAKDGMSWSLVGDQWLWTTTPTPNAPNVLNQAKSSTGNAVPADPKSSTPKARVASSKAASVKAGSTPTKPRSSKAPAAPVAPASLVADTTPTPVHASVLAFAALFALLYGAYEYRRDVANRFYQLRSYRSARRQARAGLARRRSG